jgi:hypothetical protein
MKQKRQIFKVNYHITYNSGANYKGTRDVLAISENGAIDIIKWLFKARNINIISVKPTFEYIGQPIMSDYKVLGDY